MVLVLNLGADSLIGLKAAAVSRVRRQKRLIAARMSSADLVQRNGLGSALWASM